MARVFYDPGGAWPSGAERKKNVPVQLARLISLQYASDFRHNSARKGTLGKEQTKLELMVSAAKLMRAEFDYIHQVHHNALRGGEAEEIVRKFLRKVLPSRFGVVSGFVIGHDDTYAKQTDVIIYDTLNCSPLRADDNTWIVPIDNVAAVVEVKSTLTKDELQDAAAKIESVKRLSRSPFNRFTKVGATEPPEQGSRASTTVGLERASTLGVVFAFDCSLSVEKVLEHYATAVVDHHLGKHVDLVVLLDSAMLSIGCALDAKGWNSICVEDRLSNVEGMHYSFVARNYGEMTLAALVRVLVPTIMAFRQVTPMDQLPPADGSCIYWTSITNETDPEKRKKILAGYRDIALEVS